MAIGTAEFTVRGEAIAALAQPHRFYLLQRVQDAYRDMDPTEQASIDALLKDCDMSDLLSITLDRRISRSDNLEVWEA